jgi:tRNA pseudouridine38-40 synthase
MGGTGKSGREAATAKRARESVSVRYRARVEYDGTDFAGFQLQARGRTVQGELESALARLSGGARVTVAGAGRTDAGVHAREQVIAFTYRGRLGRGELQRALSALLPIDIGLGPLHKVEADFQPRHRARYREYRYRIWNGPPSPLRERFALGVREPLDLRAMARAGRVFVGRHDFSAFGGTDRQPVRTLRRVQIAQEVGRGGRLITIRVVGDAFLRGMVRRIVAALLRVGHGTASADEVRRQLAAKAAAWHGETAPARGLTLWKVPMGPPHERHGRTKNEKSDKREQEQDNQE